MYEVNISFGEKKIFFITEGIFVLDHQTEVNIDGKSNNRKSEKG
jgi:hypothetical protein